MIAREVGEMSLVGILDVLQVIGECEKEIEDHKKRLVMEGGQDYNTIDAFRLIDKQGQGSVNYQELYQFLSNNLIQYGVEFSEDDLALFMLRFDKHERQRIKYSEFCSAFAPISPRSQQVLVHRHPINTQLEMSYDEVFVLQTRELYQMCWKLLFFSEQMYEKMR